MKINKQIDEDLFVILKSDCHYIELYFVNKKNEIMNIPQDLILCATPSFISGFIYRVQNQFNEKFYLHREYDYTLNYLGKTWSLTNRATWDLAGANKPMDYE